MAIVTTPISNTDIAKRALDKPCVVGRNELERAYQAAAANLIANTTGTVAGGDASAAFPNGRDVLTMRFRHRLWKFGSSVATTYIVIDTGATLLDVDTLIIDTHNLSGYTITVEADSTTPAVPWVGATTVFTFVAGSANIVKFHAASSFKARYWRITISGGAGAFVAQAAGIYLGKAIQFLNKSDNPYPAVISGHGVVDRKMTGGGVSYAYKIAGKLQVRKQNFVFPGIYKYTAVSDPEIFIENFRDFFDNSNSIDGGFKAFWWVEDPATSPSTAKLVFFETPEFPPVNAGPQATHFSISTTEQGAG